MPKTKYAGSMLTMTSLLTILALLLALPMQMAGFSKAMAHLQEHRTESRSIAHEHEHEKDHAHPHSHEPSEHEHEHEIADAETDTHSSPDEHSHGDDPTPHSHAKDLSLNFLQTGKSDRTEFTFEFKMSINTFYPSLDLASTKSRQSYLSLLRPPISA